MIFGSLAHPAASHLDLPGALHARVPACPSQGGVGFLSHRLPIADSNLAGSRPALAAACQRIASTACSPAKSRSSCAWR